MAFGAAESRGKKCSDQFPGKRMAGHQAAQADHVQVDVLNPLAR